MNQRLTEIAAVGELVGAAAIVVSLVFVGFEIRANTRATQAATFQEHMGYEIEILSALATNELAARAFNAGADESGTLSEPERQSRNFMLLATMRLWEGFYLQHQAGTLSDEGWVAREPSIRQFALGLEDFWLREGIFSGQFREYLISVRSEVQ
jgi:hypothetical protein